MRTISVISQKGGAGKTTLSVHLAAAAQRAGLETLIIDADPQATASTWSSWRKGAAPEVIDCASPPLIARKLERAAEAGAELVVLDTPPSSDSMTAAACRAGDLILIPCRPRGFDLAAIRATADLVQASGKQGFVVFMAGPPRASRLYAEASEAVASFGLDLAPVHLSERAAYHQATTQGLTAFEIGSAATAAGEALALWEWVRQQVNLSTRQQEASK